MAQLIVAADFDADMLVCEDGLSFWGGVDPDTGVIIDAHHPLCGRSLAGRAVLMPTSRGSCSGSGVLLQLALNGKAPAALVFREAEEVLTLGALIAAHMFDRPLAVIRLSGADFAAIGEAERLSLSGTRLGAGSRSVTLAQVSEADLVLSQADHRMLAGEDRPGTGPAMQILCRMAAAQGATELIDVTRGHIDGCIYAHEANLIFAQKMAAEGARVAIPTTINAISVDMRPQAEVRPDVGFAAKARSLAEAYTGMGARPTFTCAPYFAEAPPGFGERIGWSESNAVIYANTVLGARTPKHPDYLDLFIAITGRAPHSGVYLEENRRPQAILDVDLPDGSDDALWPLLGWVAGRLSPDRIPLLRGLEGLSPTDEDLRALCAAVGTTSAAPMLHVAGITPEADLPPRDAAPVLRIGPGDLLAAWRGFNEGPERVDLIALGSPHLSSTEVKAFADLLGPEKSDAVEVILTTSRAALAEDGIGQRVSDMATTGVRVMADLCWCSITEPAFPAAATCLMTNSAKYAHYAPGLSGRAVRFGSLADCAEAAKTGRAPTQPPVWLRQ